MPRRPWPGRKSALSRRWHGFSSLPRSLAPRLTASGIAAEDVRDRALRGQPDDAVFRHAVTHGFALLSGDLGFANLVRFPLGTHHGIVVARFSNDWPVEALNTALQATQPCLIIIEPGRVRLRRRV